MGMVYLAQEAGDLVDGLTGTGPRPGARRAALPAGLTVREAEVLQLLAAGRTNREIADELVLSVRTVDHHIAAIYRKTGARRRADAAAYALRHGLAGSTPER